MQKTSIYPKTLTKLIKKKNSLIFLLSSLLVLNSCKSNTNFDSTGNYQKGLNYLNQDKFEEAINEFDEELLNNPRNELVYYNRDIAKSKLNFWKDAIKDYDQTINLDSKDYLANFSKANALKNLNKFSEAIKNYDLTIQINPTYAKAFFNRANTFRELNKYESAIYDYLKAISIDTTNYEYYYNLGNVYKKIISLMMLKYHTRKVFKIILISHLLIII